jgi:site-specific recombinase XerD
MSTLRQSAQEYLAMRRSLGYQLQTQGRLLLEFVDYLQHTGADTITVEAAVAWARQPVGAAPIWWARRLSVVRCFARHLTTLDPACQVPPTDLLLARYQRITPYLYSPSEIAALVHAAGTLAVPLRAATYQALISLLAVSGLRVGRPRRWAAEDREQQVRQVASGACALEHRGDAAPLHHPP